MTAIALTAALVSRVFPQNDEVMSVKLAEAVTQGAPAYQTTSGTYGLADANAAGKQQFRGVFLEAGAAGDVVPLLKRGWLYGYTLGTIETPIYLSDTVGVFDDSAGTMTVVCGRVCTLADGTTKILYVEARWTHIWA